MGALCYRITYDVVHLKLLHIFKKYILENAKEYIWFWTDKIKHTCYIEIIQDQYAIIIDNFIYRFNRLLCALGKGGEGVITNFILYFMKLIGQNFLKKLSTGTRY